MRCDYVNHSIGVVASFIRYEIRRTLIIHYKPQHASYENVGDPTKNCPERCYVVSGYCETLGTVRRWYIEAEDCNDSIAQNE